MEEKLQGIFICIIIIYIIILIDPFQNHPVRFPPFIIEPVNKDDFNTFINQVNEYQNKKWSFDANGGADATTDTIYKSKVDDVSQDNNNNQNDNRNNQDNYNGNSFVKDGKGDDFFFDVNKMKLSSNTNMKSNDKDMNFKSKVIVPSKEFYCTKGWVIIRSTLNYKYLWMHEKDTTWMSATAPVDTGVHHRAFEIIPIPVPSSSSSSSSSSTTTTTTTTTTIDNNVADLNNNNNNNSSSSSSSSHCTEDHGWVKLRPYDQPGFVAMNGPKSNSDSTWVVQVKSHDHAVADTNPDYHFLLEKTGYILNRGSMAFVNVINNPDYPVRGHGADYFIERTPAVRETGALMEYQFVPEKVVIEADNHEKEEENESLDEDKRLKEVIKSFKSSSNNEKRVISFGLYGRNPKYTMGAITNVELVNDYFPGWVCRFYVSSDVPSDVIDELKSKGAEISLIPNNGGYVAGMFYRFLVADDKSVDRYIIRDTDSRLNARDAIAVQEWILSKRPIHILRDHVNHCIPINGGMWGGVKGAIHNMKQLIEDWSNKDEYGSDLHFLEDVIWPSVYDSSISLQHDSYCCDKYPSTRPFPTKRYPNYQHVGQVFAADGSSRLTDIDGFIRGVPVPRECRKRPEYIYG